MKEPIDYTLDVSKIVPGLVRGLLENLPEQSNSLPCVKWNYSTMEFLVVDQDTDTNHTLTLPMAEVGFMKLARAMIDGKFPGLDASDNPLSADLWDEPAIDALVQMSVLGEVIYG